MGGGTEDGPEFELVDVVTEVSLFFSSLESDFFSTAKIFFTDRLLGREKSPPLLESMTELICDRFFFQTL